jgi:hypothetical protein
VDRISALRNVEDALRDFEEGRVDLAEAERRVGTVLRTYATEFEADDESLSTYRARGASGAGGPGDPGEGHAGDVDDAASVPEAAVVVADSVGEARERLADALGVPVDAAFEVERL